MMYLQFSNIFEQQNKINNFQTLTTLIHTLNASDRKLFISWWTSTAGRGISIEMGGLAITHTWQTDR